MRAPPPVTQILKYPVTALTGLAAVSVTAAWWLGMPINALVMDPRFWPGEPWRLITSTLPHINLAHLAFNVYWLWIFGSILERSLGRLNTLGVFVLLGVGSSAAEFA